MLTHIHIRDFAIIDRLELELDGGFCVLTGETGAGKSILVDALGLVLGDRADNGAIRDGAESAEISVAIDLRAQAEAREWLEAQALEVGDECLLRRVIARDGRSRAWLNGAPATLAMLKSLGEMLVDIHGQHEHHSLLRADQQRQLLDSHAGNADALQRLAAIHRDWQQAARRLGDLSAESSHREARLELLRFQVQELAALEPAEGEPEALTAEQQRLAHAGQLRDTALNTYYTLYGGDEDTLHARLNQLLRNLETIEALDPAAGEYRELLSGAELQMREAANGLRRYGEGVDLDPERMNQVEQRLTALHDLARKHRVKPEVLPTRLNELAAELAELEGPEQNLEQLQGKVDALAANHEQLALEIRAARCAAAKVLSAGTTLAMQDLGMPGGRFEIAVLPREDSAPSPTGLDRIEFRVSTNPGQALKPLAKTASGGELSRISLAIQMVAATRSRIPSLQIPVLIFDEVDVGIGGAVAEVVGRQLRALGRTRQVLCVTHLPQVAAQADHHYQVEKRSVRGASLAAITPLNPPARVDEIARMLGGVELTAQTRAHAEEMIVRARAD